jgi:hypothetical protein
MLPFLHELSKYVDRTYAVAKNVIHQLAALYNPQQKMLTSFKTVHLESVFETLGDLFVVLVTLDEIITRNDAWNNGLNMYRR